MADTPSPPTPPSPLPPAIPRLQSEITPDWVLGLVLHLNQLDGKHVAHIRSCNSSSSGEITITDQDKSQGVLSDICKVFVRLEQRRTDNNCRLGLNLTKPLVVQNLFIKIIPSQLRDLVIRHHLFQREIVFYRDLLPKLKDFLHSCDPKMKFCHFGVPRFLFGTDPSEENGNPEEDVNKEEGAVLVLEDLSARGFQLCDQSLQLFTYDHMKAAIQSLAEFHAVCHVYDKRQSKRIRDVYPTFASEKLMWFQEDMVQFLEALTKTAGEFLDSIPGEQQTARRYLARMSDPLVLYQQELARPSQFETLQHGDSWHNNFLFHRSRQGLRVAVVDWQVSHWGRGPSDLCYLLYSTTTGLFRRKYLDNLLKEYFDVFVRTAKQCGLGQDEYDPAFGDFQEEFRQSLPLCLLFCGSAEDLRLKDLDESTPEEVRKANQRRTSLASDKEVVDSEDPLRRRTMDRRASRALRRKNYLDICREAARLGII